SPIYDKLAQNDRSVSTKERAIPQPPADKAILAKIISGHENQTLGAERVANELRHYDAATYERLTRENKEEATKLFGIEQGYGFKVCGVGLHSTSSSGSTSPSASPGSSSSGPPKHHIGQSAGVGNLQLRPVAFERL